MNTKTIYCKYCHQRLFDIIPGTKGRIEIKCSRCKKLIKITLFSLEPKQNSDYLAKE